MPGSRQKRHIKQRVFPPSVMQRADFLFSGRKSPPVAFFFRAIVGKVEKSSETRPPRKNIPVKDRKRDVLTGSGKRSLRPPGKYSSCKRRDRASAYVSELKSPVRGNVSQVSRYLHHTASVPFRRVFLMPEARTISAGKRCPRKRTACS